MGRRQTVGNTPLSRHRLPLCEETLVAVGAAISVVLAGGVAVSGWWAWEAQQTGLWKLLAAMCLLCAGEALGLVILRRRMRGGFSSMEAIRQALLAIDAGEAGLASLSVSGDLNREGAAWNKLLGEIEQARKGGLAERAKHSLGTASSANSELGGAFDAMPNGMILIDDRMRVKYTNGAAAVLLAVKREEMPGADITSLILDEDVQDSIRSVVKGSGLRRSSVETEHRENGNFQALRFSVRLMRQDDSAAAMIVIEDITQQRIASESRDAFVAQATHELRAPLTNIRLYIETAMEEGQDDAAIRAKCLNVVNQEARRLERIVGDMLSVSEMEAGVFKLQVDDVPLTTVFDELKSNYEAQARDKQIAMDFDLAPNLSMVRGDRDKIVLALQNLLSNAIKYTTAPGKVHLSAEVKMDKLVVEVCDTGIGINEGDSQRIFEKFFRAKDRRVEKVIGSGLGLAIAREAIRLHGGDITVESEVGKGSRFTLTLPVVAEAA